MVVVVALHLAATPLGPHVVAVEHVIAAQLVGVVVEELAVAIEIARRIGFSAVGRREARVLAGEHPLHRRAAIVRLRPEERGHDVDGLRRLMPRSAVHAAAGRAVEQASQALFDLAIMIGPRVDGTGHGVGLALKNSGVFWIVVEMRQSLHVQSARAGVDLFRAGALEELGDLVHQIVCVTR